MPETTDKPKRRWRPRWSMRAMFLGVTVFCVVLGLVVVPAERQKRAVEALREIDDVWVDYDFEVEYERHFYETHVVYMGPPPHVPESSLPGPAWLRDLIGIDYFADVGAVSIDGRRFGKEIRIRDGDLRHLRHFSKLKSLCVSECDSITDGGLKHLTKLTSLTYLDLSRNKLTTLPPEIGQLINLTTLKFDSTSLTVLPPEIGQLTELALLDLSSNRFTALPPEIGKLTKLRDLYLGGNAITDTDLEYLKSLENLDYIILHGTNVTRKGVADLQLALPNCGILINFD